MRKHSISGTPGGEIAAGVQAELVRRGVSPDEVAKLDSDKATNLVRILRKQAVLRKGKKKSN